MIPKEWDGRSAKQLNDVGYRRTSNKYRLIARVDRPDWLDALALELRNPYSTNGPDFYRRVLSKDVMEVPSHIFREIFGSGHDPTGYREEETCSTSSE